MLTKDVLGPLSKGRACLHTHRALGLAGLTRPREQPQTHCGLGVRDVNLLCQSDTGTELQLPKIHSSCDTTNLNPSKSNAGQPHLTQDCYSSPPSVRNTLPEHKRHREEQIDNSLPKAVLPRHLAPLCYQSQTPKASFTTVETASNSRRLTPFSYQKWDAP